MTFTWQEPLVAVIVGFAVVFLYRHFQGMFSVPDTGGDASCHRCDDCTTDEKDSATTQ